MAWGWYECGASADGWCKRKEEAPGGSRTRVLAKEESARSGDAVRNNDAPPGRTWVPEGGSGRWQTVDIPP